MADCLFHQNFSCDITLYYLLHPLCKRVNELLTVHTAYDVVKLRPVWYFSYTPEGCSRWTMQAIADELIRLEVVEYITDNMVRHRMVYTRSKC